MPEHIKFNGLFPVDKPVIGMIHLAGRGNDEKIKRALEELIIYESEGVDGAIIENYHGSVKNVHEVLRQSQWKFNLVIGINVLRNPYLEFSLAYNYGARFVQFDSVQTPDLNLNLYDGLREEYPNIAVLGGIGFKYTSPTGNPLEIDLIEGKSRCEAIVTTGSGTGIETPIQKLKEYKRLLKEFPLIVGAGINLGNVCEQLQICDGAIIGSYFKPNGDTRLPVDNIKVREMINLVNKIRIEI